MKIILVGRHHGRSRSFTLSGWTRSLLSLCLLGIPVGLGVLLGQQMPRDTGGGVMTADLARSWSDALTAQNRQMEAVKREAEGKLAALTLRLVELQAKVLRLDALGERLTSIAKLDEGEFDFSQPPAVGGPESLELGEAFEAPDFVQEIHRLSDQIADRELQLETLETLLAKRKIQQDLFVAGRPVVKGWMSSRFGRRADPFNGLVSWHNGVDFAGKLGSEVISVASGVVTWSGERTGYGQLIEVSHGHGFTTRYAHNSENLVDVGEVIKKGQAIALMGSSGRSTGPHVHFEVYKHGRAVDPASYIHRTLR